MGILDRSYIPAVAITHAPSSSPRSDAPVTERGAPPAGPGPLSAEHYQLLAEARVRSKKLRRAATIAAISGWSMAFFAFCSILGGLFGDLGSLLLGAGLGIAAFNELRGGAMLRRFEARGATLLARNQLGLGIVLVLYAGFKMWAASRQDPLAQVGGTTGDAEIDKMVTDVTSMVTYGLYGTLAVIGIIVPGLTALYYHTRGTLVRSVVASTPPWVIEALRAAG